MTRAGGVPLFGPPLARESKTRRRVGRQDSDRIKIRKVNLACGVKQKILRRGKVCLVRPLRHPKKTVARRQRS